MIFRLIDWWLARKGYVRIRRTDDWDFVPLGVQLLTSAAGVICREVDPAPQSGEWKRHQVYARMLKAYPSAKKRDVALAIERAVQAEV